MLIVVQMSSYTTFSYVFYSVRQRWRYRVCANRMPNDGRSAVQHCAHSHCLLSGLAVRKLATGGKRALLLYVQNSMESSVPRTVV